MKKIQSSHPAADLWHNFVVKRIQPELNVIVEKALSERNVHPFDLAKHENDWPTLEYHAASAHSSVGLQLFGCGAIVAGNNSLRAPLQHAVASLISVNWTRLEEAYNIKRAFMRRKVQAMDRVWEGK